MPNSDLPPSLLNKLNENQLALGAAIMELSNWVGARGSAGRRRQRPRRPAWRKPNTRSHLNNAAKV